MNITIQGNIGGGSPPSPRGYLLFLVFLALWEHLAEKKLLALVEWCEIPQAIF